MKNNIINSKKIKDIYEKTKRFNQPIFEIFDGLIFKQYKDLFLDIGEVNDYLLIHISKASIRSSEAVIVFRSNPILSVKDAIAAFEKLESAIRKYQSDDIGYVLEKLSGIECN